MIIGLYFKNLNIKGIDIPDLKKGNPGIGGAEYHTLLLLQLINERTNYNVVLFVTSPINIYLSNKEKITVIVVKGLNDVVSYCNSHLVNILITRFIEESILFAKLKSTKVIVTQHGWNIDDKNRINLSNIECVKHVVFSSSQSYCRYLDYDINKKSLFIYPGYVENLYTSYDKPHKHEVVYLGSLHPNKNFHDLVDSWPKVISKIPSAHLTVIGGMQLWERGEPVGKLGVASPSYEKRLLKPLVDNNVLDTVSFVGIKGAEKYDYIKKSDLGVITLCPGETFCISALDIISARRRLVCVRQYGFLESTTRKVAANYKTKQNIAKTIIKELKRNKSISKKDTDYINKFNIDNFYKNYIKLIDATYHDKKINFGRNIKYIFKGGKLFRLIFRIIRRVFRLSEKVNYDNFHYFFEKRIKH